MTSSGRELGADIYELWRAGHENLPNVAAQFSDSASTLAAYSYGYKFYRSGSLGAGGMYGAYDAWNSLAGTLDGIMRETADNIVDTGNALVLAADMYAATDADAAAEFNRRKREGLGD